MYRAGQGVITYYVGSAVVRGRRGVPLRLQHKYMKNKYLTIRVVSPPVKLELL